MLNRWVERGLLDVLGQEGIGCIAFSPLAQGLLTVKYLGGVPEESRAADPDSYFERRFLTEENLERVRNLNEIARRRGQSLAQMALVWVARDPRVTTVLIGASRPEQIEENVAAFDRPEFTPEELKEIDRWAVDSNVNLWAASSDVE